jgi:hypothetical protein
MAYEWTSVELYGQNNDGEVRRYTIADGTSVSKGTLMQLLDNRIVQIAATTCACGGVAAEEHPANVGVTSIPCWTDGIFIATASGAIAIGMPVAADSKTTNTLICPASAQLCSGAINIGYALNAAAADGKVQVRLKL